MSAKTTARDLAGDALLDPALRRIVATDFKGTAPLAHSAEAFPGLSWTVLSADEASGRQVVLVRSAPGVRGPVHLHDGPEELLVLDGTVTDSDGTVFAAGDFIRYEPGSRHDTYSATGCTLLAISRNPPKKP